jgi:hypothetical protein
MRFEMDGSALALDGAGEGPNNGEPPWFPPPAALRRVDPGVAVPYASARLSLLVLRERCRELRVAEYNGVASSARAAAPEERYSSGVIVFGSVAAVSDGESDAAAASAAAVTEEAAVENRKECS